MRLVDNCKVVTAFNPVDLIGGPTAGGYVSMQNYGHLTIILKIGAAAASSAAAVTLNQATAVAGTGAKSLGFTTMGFNSNTAGSDTLVATTVTSNTFNTIEDGADAMYVIDIDASELDTTNGFDCVNINIADAGASSIADCTYVLSQPRYAAGDSTPSAITD